MSGGAGAGVEVTIGRRVGRVGTGVGADAAGLVGVGAAGRGVAAAGTWACCWPVGWVGAGAAGRVAAASPVAGFGGGPTVGIGEAATTGEARPRMIASTVLSGVGWGIDARSEAAGSRAHPTRRPTSAAPANSCLAARPRPDRGEWACTRKSCSPTQRCSSYPNSGRAYYRASRAGPAAPRGGGPFMRGSGGSPP